MLQSGDEQRDLQRGLEGGNRKTLCESWKIFSRLIHDCVLSSGKPSQMRELTSPSRLCLISQHEIRTLNLLLVQWVITFNHRLGGYPGIFSNCSVFCLGECALIHHLFAIVERIKKMGNMEGRRILGGLWFKILLSLNWWGIFTCDEIFNGLKY